MVLFQRRTLLVFVVVLAACRPEPRPLAPSPVPPLATPARFVGRAVCAGCHPSEAWRWQGSHHDLAMQVATPETVLARSQATPAGPGLARFVRRGDAWVADADGPDGRWSTFPVRYTFGLEPLQQYLLELPNGELRASTVAWDARPAAAGGQRFYDLNAGEVRPGHRVVAGDPLHWTGLNQRWSSMCAECHSTQVEKGYLPAEDRFETRFAELDVACEACHGPGSRHAESARHGRPEPLWTRPAAGAAGGLAEVEVCGRCHARRTPLRPTPAYDSPLVDSYLPALLDADLYFADGQIEGEVFEVGSFLQSKMHHRGVSCADCHEPHAGTLRAAGNALCLRCHDAARFDRGEHHQHAAGSAGAACVACHMPERTYMGVDRRRDHSLRVPRPDLSAATGAPDACTACHTDRSPAWAAAAIARHRGGPPPARRWGDWGPALAAGRARQPGAETALQVLVDDGEVPAIVRGTALGLLGAQATPPPAALLTAAVADREALVRLGAVRAAEGLPAGERWPLLGGLLDDPLLAVRVEAARALAATPREALAPPDRRRLERAVGELRSGLGTTAERPESQTALGLLALAEGDLAAAETAFDRALRADPSFLAAAVDLAEVYRLSGRDAAGEPLLRAALARSPEAPPATRAATHHALGLLLVRRGDLAGAHEPLSRAVELAPAEVRYATVLAALGAALGGESGPRSHRDPTGARR